MPLYLRHCAVGFCLSAVFVAMILWLDIARIGSLVMGSDIGWLAVFLLWFFHGTIFGSAQFAVSIMLNTDKDDNHRDGDGTAVAIPVAAAR